MPRTTRSSRSGSHSHRASCIPRASWQKKKQKMGTRKSSRLAQKTFLFRWPKLLFYGSPAVAPRGVWVMLCATCCMVLCVCEWICGTAGHCTCVRDACVTVCLWVCGSFIAQSAGALFCEFSTEFRPFPTGFPSRIFVFADSFDLVSTRDCMRNWWPANSWHLFICPASRPKTNNKYLAVGMAMQVLFFHISSPAHMDSFITISTLLLSLFYVQLSSS